MALLARLAPLFFLFVLVAAQQQVQLLNYDALPGCAKGCTNLKTAQDGCIPPQAGVSNQQTYVSCFCQSAFLVNLKTTAQGLCDAQCPSTSDQNAIKDWYNKFCQSGGTVGAAGGGAGGGGGGGGGGTKTQPSKTANSPSPSPSTAKNNNNEQGVVSDKTSYQGSWISAHWRWIVMIVVIFTGLTLLTLLGLCLKRRARARHDARQANVAAPEAAFAAPLPPVAPPMAHQHHKYTPDDSGTLTSTIDFGSTSSIAAAAGPNSSVGNIAQNFLGRNRSRSNHLGRFPNTSQNNVVQPVPSPINVWGPHQHQAATRGYEYPTYQNGIGRAPSRSDPRLNGYGSTDASPVSPSPVAGSPNASFPHIAAGAAGAAFPPSSHGHGHTHGPGPSPLGAGAGSGTPRKSSSRGELANKAVPPVPLIASAANAPAPSTTPPPASRSPRSGSGRDRTPPSARARSAGSASSRPEVPRLNTAVGANASGGNKALPPTPPPVQQRQPTTPTRQTQPTAYHQPQTPPHVTAGAAATTTTTPPPIPRTPPANGSRRRGAEDDRHHTRTLSQEYGAAATYHNAGFATGGSVYRRNNNNNNAKNQTQDVGAGAEDAGFLRGRTTTARGGALIAADEIKRSKDDGMLGVGGDSTGWSAVNDAVAGAANKVARSFDDLHTPYTQPNIPIRSTSSGLARSGTDNLGSHRRVMSPLSADNAREKLRRKLSRQGSGFFDEAGGVEGRGEREGFEGRL
ncbi:hypothetical protein JOL62DRAFT_616170 [Phyllosticta paracitricarpa]|uniref:Integral membrane protein n=1 Tax=Phyllosticta paracitricarpa TaxID=2016321 RepID=A0ABR1MW85_9PEZI